MKRRSLKKNYRELSQRWIASFNPHHEWHWALFLPEDWTAIVVDDSQVGTPTRPTDYRIMVAHGESMVSFATVYEDFYTAKREALLSALSLQVRATPAVA